MFKKPPSTPKIYEIDGHKYQKHYIYKKLYERDVFIIKDCRIDQGITHESLELFEKIKDQFKRFSNASIGDPSENPNEDKSYLILTDTEGNELHLTGCTCGYTGTGPHGTAEVLDKAGFDVGRRFVFSAKSFSVNHPETEIQMYGERL